MDAIWKTKARWFGHIMRSEGLMGTAMEGRVEGKGPIGRKRAVMLDDMKQKLPCYEERRLETADVFRQTT